MYACMHGRSRNVSMSVGFYVFCVFLCVFIGFLVFAVRSGNLRRDPLSFSMIVFSLSLPRSPHSQAASWRFHLIASSLICLVSTCFSTIFHVSGFIFVFFLAAECLQNRPLGCPRTPADTHHSTEHPQKSFPRYAPFCCDLHR